MNESYFDEVREILNGLDRSVIDNIVEILHDTQQLGGRVFVLGIGGSAANASHFVNDLRKLCGIEAYAPTDNVSEFSARANDEGMADVFAPWLEGSKLNNNDCIFVLSVGGGDADRNVSVGLVRAIDYAHHPDIDAMVLGICGRKEGHLAKEGDYVVIIPNVEPSRITPHTEEFQSVICHYLVSHPDLMTNKTKW